MAARNVSLPEIHPLNLSQFFQSSYLVPSYQRNYSWTDVEVETLMDDLIEYFKDNKAPYYLLGDVIIVASKNKDFDFEIIDGQQRITTLVLIFSALIRRLIALDTDQMEVGELRTLIYRSRRVPIRMSGKATESVQQFLTTDAKVDDLPKSTPSQLAVINAIESINKKLDEEFGEKAKAKSILSFFEKIKKTVYLSQLKLSDAESAFEFFERVNDRGRPLSKTDLLKNRLLQKISDSEYEAASETWAEAEKRLLRHGREGSISFLMRQLIIADLGTKIKDSDLFKKWKDVIKDDSGALRVVDRIDVSSKALDAVLAGNTPAGTIDLHAVSTGYMKFTQNVVVKLAGAHLNPRAYDTLSKRLEARALLSLFSLERSQTYESEVAKWAKSVQALDVNASDSAVVNAVSVPQADIDVLLARALPVIDSLRYGTKPGHTSRIRLLLAKINFELLTLAPIHHYGLIDLLSTSKKVRGTIHPGYDIEHVGAKSTAAHLGDLVDSVGNLTLFFSGDNRSLGNADVLYKQESYAESICFATNLLTNTSRHANVEAVIGSYRTSVVDKGTWDITDVNERLEMYWKIFEKAIRRDLIASPKPKASEA
jgi:Protein of unknown function DUF262/Protein of unknown function (DUF1524)